MANNTLNIAFMMSSTQLHGTSRDMSYIIHVCFSMENVFYLSAEYPDLNQDTEYPDLNQDTEYEHLRLIQDTHPEYPNPMPEESD